MSRFEHTLLTVVIAAACVLLLYRAFPGREEVVETTAEMAGTVSDILQPTRIDLTTVGSCIVQNIRAKQDLCTAEFNWEVVLEDSLREVRRGWFDGRVSIWMSVPGTVSAGVDLSSFSVDRITLLEGGITTIVIRLPEPVIFGTDLNTAAIEQRIDSHGPLSNTQRQQLVNDLEYTLRERAKEELEAAAVDHGILDSARNRAEDVVVAAVSALDLGAPFDVSVEFGSPRASRELACSSR